MSTFDTDNTYPGQEPQLPTQWIAGLLGADTASTTRDAVVKAGLDNLELVLTLLHAVAERIESTPNPPGPLERRRLMVQLVYGISRARQTALHLSEVVTEVGA